MTEEVAGEFGLHVLAIGLEDRPGAVHSVAEVFSGRGLQMEAFFGTADSLNPGSHAQALILFRAAPPRAELVTRVLRRLSSVRRAELLPADDPRLVFSLLVVADADADAAAVPAGVRLAPLAYGLALAAGSGAALQAWLESPTAPRRVGALRVDLGPG